MKNLPGGVLNGLHPIGAAFLKLAEAIEKLPASTDQTAACVARTKCAEVVQAEYEKLEKHKDFTYCAYCGHEELCDDQAATKISRHIKTCKKHPMRKLEEENTRIIQVNALMFSALTALSGEDGMPQPKDHNAFAKESLNKVKELLQPIEIIEKSDTQASN